MVGTSGAISKWTWEPRAEGDRSVLCGKDTGWIWGVFFVVAVQTVTWLVLTCSLVSPDLDFVLTASQAFAKQQSCHKESSLSSQKAKL